MDPAQSHGAVTTASLFKKTLRALSRKSLSENPLSTSRTKLVRAFDSRSAPCFAKIDLMEVTTPSVLATLSLPGLARSGRRPRNVRVLEMCEELSR